MGLLCREETGSSPETTRLGKGKGFRVTKKGGCCPDTDRLSFLFRYGPVVGDIGGRLVVLVDPSIRCMVVKQALNILVQYNSIFSPPPSFLCQYAPFLP